MNFLLVLTLIVTISVQSRQDNVSLDPCNDFYDYVCTNDTRIITKLNFTSLFEDREILNPNISFPNNGTYITLDEILDPDSLMIWYLKIELLNTTTADFDYFFKMHREYVKKENKSEKFSFVVETLENVNVTIIITKSNMISNDLADSVGRLSEKCIKLKYFHDVPLQTTIFPIKKDLPVLGDVELVFEAIAICGVRREYFIIIREYNLKNALETILSGLCIQGKPKNSILPRHPFEISINTAVRQYPLFSSLYGCRPGDRMYAEPEKFCNPLGGEVNLEDYCRILYY